MLGATGTIGQATVRALLARGHEVVCFVRPRAGVGGRLQGGDMARLFPGAVVRVGDVQDPVSLARDGFQGEHFDVLVSCLASRTGALTVVGVLTALYPLGTILLARLVLKEHVATTQKIGIALTLSASLLLALA